MEDGKVGAKTFTILPSFHLPNPLLAYEHFSGGGEIVCGERVEIDTACDGFTDFVFAVPIRCTASRLIDARCLMA